MITEFQGKYRFLSNFWRGDDQKIRLNDLIFDNVECAYQAAKSSEPEEQKTYVGLTPGQAKRAGRHVTLRKDWEEVKVGVMLDLLRQKFAPNTELSFKLLKTHGEVLVEGNTWNDRFWGQCPVGRGQNMLGQLLMQVRGELAQ